MKNTVAATMLLAVLLGGCGPVSDTSAVATRPPIALPTPLSAAPGATAVAVGGSAALSGKLLFVQRGAIWLWQGGSGQAIIGGGVAFQPAFSPDGARIAYVERGASYSDLMLSDTAGIHIAQLTANGSRQPPGSAGRIYETTWAFYPSWFPDGAAVLFAGQAAPPSGDPAAEYTPALYRTDAAGQQSREPVVSDSAAACGRSVVAPDGTVYYVRAETTQGGAQQVYRGTPGAPLPGLPTPSYDPALSPAGTWLAVAARSDTGTDIWLVPTAPGATTTPLRITNSGVARAPAFSPDGRTVAYLSLTAGRGFDLWAVDLSPTTGGLLPGEPRQITNAMDIDADSGLSWAP
jgi:TolB protein